MPSLRGRRTCWGEYGSERADYLRRFRASKGARAKSGQSLLDVCGCVRLFFQWTEEEAASGGSSFG